MQAKEFSNTLKTAEKGVLNGQSVEEVQEFLNRKGISVNFEQTSQFEKDVLAKNTPIPNSLD